MPAAKKGNDAEALSADQRTLLLAAKAWWQEGDRSLDYFAEKSRQETLLGQLRPALEALRAETYPSGSHVAPFLRIGRLATANRALNRTLETTTFALSLRQLLFGEDPLPDRLATFLANQRIGPLTTSHLLYISFPDRFPLVSPQTRGVLAPTNQQRAAQRARVLSRYSGPLPEMPRDALDLLTDFEIYESAFRFLGLSDFTELHGILSHAREMPPGRRKARPTSPRTAKVRESASDYAQENEANTPEATESDLIRWIEGSITSQGFHFPPLTVRNYYVALKAKPFVLLTGLSGTGKTRLTRLLADALTGGVPNQYLLIPVRPDWTDSSPLLGYHNLLNDRYVPTPFLNLLIEAARVENGERAYFACLDEMNLARVEHYFAEPLSAMETPDHILPLPDGRTVTLPDNVFLTGSVNLDEATYPFSRKVLDRANTLEFTQVTLHPLPETPERVVLPEIPPLERQRLFLTARVRNVADGVRRLGEIDADFPDRTLATLSELNQRLEPRGLHFGYRVRDEALRYVAAAYADGVGLFSESPDENRRIALDFQILQKVLPRLSGTEDSLRRLLQDLENWAISEGYPRSAAKLARMRSRAAEDGIVTFYEL